MELTSLCRKEDLTIQNFILIGTLQHLRISFRDNLGSATPTGSWLDSAAQSVIPAARFRSYQTTNKNGVASMRIHSAVDAY